jgi:hypothetical protein
MRIVNSTFASPISTAKDSNERKVDLEVSELNSDFPADYRQLQKTFKKAAWYSLTLAFVVAILGIYSVSIVSSPSAEFSFCHSSASNVLFALHL